ncbi:MAG: glycosyltransferase [Candidatus Hydrogenedentes bacterium]|nr:glycosyltransferase [Candidatus Hydrogenedentota bacterium]
MRILIPTADYPPIEGGISTVTLELSRALARRGHTVTVVAPWFPDMESFDATEPVTVVRYRGYDWGWLRAWPLFRVAGPLVRRHDVILAINVAYGGLLGLLGRTIGGAPYVNFAYGYEYLKFSRNPAARLLLRLIYRGGRTTIAISRYTRDQLIQFGVAPSRIAVALPGAQLPEPVSDSAIRAARHELDLEDAPYILSVGRLIPRKGHVTLIEALARLQERGIHAHLVIAGRGPEMEACQRQAAALGLDGCVHLAGYVAPAMLGALYADCACFALPAGEDENGQVEGFGLVYTEAHAHGKPVIAGRSGGAPEAVLHEETGLLVSPRDPDAIAEALARVLGDPAYGRALGEAGRARVARELNWDRFAERVIQESGLAETPVDATQPAGRDARADE